LMGDGRSKDRTWGAAIFIMLQLLSLPPCPVNPQQIHFE